MTEAGMADLLNDPALNRCPYPFYDMMRAHTPVLEVPGFGYVLTRYEDVLTVVTSPDKYASSFGDDPSTSVLDPDCRFRGMDNVHVVDASFMPTSAGLNPSLVGLNVPQVPRHQFEFQMLYGIRRDLQRRLVAEGYRLRLYVPFGKAWYPYFMRRLAERPANLLFLARNLVR